MNQTYSDRMAFTTEKAARDYSDGKEPSEIIETAELIEIIKIRKKGSKMKQDLGSLMASIVALGEPGFITNPCMEMPMFGVRAKQIKVFERDNSIDIMGVVHQIATYDNVQTQPFVYKLAREATTDVFESAMLEDWDEFRENHIKKYDIELLGRIYKVEKLTNDYLLTGSNEEKAVKIMCQVYVEMKQIDKLIEANVEYKWIKKSLTKENVMSEELVTLFHSKKLDIVMIDGNLALKKNKSGEVFVVPVKYNIKKEKFSL